MRRFTIDNTKNPFTLILGALFLITGGTLLLAAHGHETLLLIASGAFCIVAVAAAFFYGYCLGALLMGALLSVLYDILQMFARQVAVFCFAVGGILIAYFLFEFFFQNSPEKRDRVLKVFGFFGDCLFFLTLAAVAAVFVLSIWNIVLLIRERDIVQPTGELVELDRYKTICMYDEGEGDHTLVFLSGSGTAEPILDFKGLTSQLEGCQRVVVPERLGYGFSTGLRSNDIRTAQNIVLEYRKALEKAGIEGPFILVAHSMGGLHAIIWAQEHPEEVEAIIGLDMCVPGSYENFDLKDALRRSRLGAAGRIFGFARIFYRDSFLPDTLDEQEKELYRAVACRKVSNSTVRDELRKIDDALEVIAKKDLPGIPTLLFSSDGSETGVEGWVTIQEDYAASIPDAELVLLEDCGHYMHNEQPELIAQDIKAFIDRLDS